MAFEKPYVILPTSQHTHTVILAHGKGSSGKEFADELFEGETSTCKFILDAIPSANIKWVFPNARNTLSTVFEMEQQQWFDIYSLSDPDSKSELQVAGLKKSIEHIRNIIEEERQYVSTERIVLGGISQGFATTAHVLLSSPYTFAGFCGISGWIPFQDSLRRVLDGVSTLPSFFHCELGIECNTVSNNRSTPVYITHSKDDMTVEIEHGIRARDTLREFGFTVEYHEYEDGEHWIQEPLGYDDLIKFLNASIS